MERLSRGTQKKEIIWKRIAAFLLLVVLAVDLALQTTVLTRAADATCMELCQSVLKATGNGDKIKCQSSNVGDFGSFTMSDREKVSSIMYLCDIKEIYSICVVKASKKSGAKQLLKSLKAYKSNNGSSYLSDYSFDEQKVLKNAICGRKGKYVWYIAMSSVKAVNKKGQLELKKNIVAARES